MKISSHPVVVYSMNPETHKLTVIEVTNLLAVPATFYDLDEIHSDEVNPVCGYITLIGGRTFRLRAVPPERIAQQTDGINPILEVTVPWDQIEWDDKVKAVQRRDVVREALHAIHPELDKPDAAPPEMKPDER